MAGVSCASSRPVRVAPRVHLYPAGATPPSPRDVLALPTLPSAAFGDGTHPTTRLCARAVDYRCRCRRPRAVLDVGTGTGVLARIARAHEVPFVAATDIDAVALEAARANAALDSRSGELVVCDAPPDAWGPRFDLVVANILDDVLRELAPGLVAALASDGILLLCGFTPVQAPRLRVAFERHGLAADLESELAGWALLQLERRPHA